MKLFLSIFVLLIFMVSPAFSADFSPTQLKLSIPATVQYDFDGSSLDIPVTVGGTNAAGYFVVNTRGQAANIGVVQNGHLGWHYVNGIDTCVYSSGLIEFQMGSNTIVWDGKTSDGGTVPDGEYTYYVWAYDNIGSKTLVSEFIPFANGWNRTTLLTLGTDGTPLTNPLFVRAPTRYISAATDSLGVPFLTEDECLKWTIGSDPSDETLLETTTIFNWAICGGLGFLPTDHTMFFADNSFDNQTKITRKWQWIPNGAGILQEDWGEGGAFEYASFNEAGWETGPGAHPDGKDYLIVGDGDISGGTQVARLFYIDINDGTEVQRLDISEWWVRNEEGGQASSVANNIEIHHDRMLLHGNTTCQNMLLDPNYESDEDAILWVNQNGDYINDINYAEDAEHPWVCAEYRGPWKYNSSMDENLFNGNALYDLGALSFALQAPDGTGLGYMAFAGETAGAHAGFKFIDSGSAYDGLLVDNLTTGAEGETDGLWWIASESQKGIISSSPTAVNDDASAFSVSQNSPNPFNPTTTISFNLSIAGNTTIDVFNVAGQKIDTLVSEFMNTGSHSVTWDATGISAGVYFYTVKSGDFSKTVKMTLLK